jgi:hypothetical protein
MGTENFVAIRNREGKWLERMLEIIPSGTTELAVHPGNAEVWRLEEKSPLVAPNFKELIRNQDIKLTSFNDLLVT